MTNAEIRAAIDQHFDPVVCFVDPLSRQGDVSSVLGFDLTDQELFKIVGAPTGSIVKYDLVQATTDPAGANDPAQKVERLPAGLRVVISNGQYLEEPLVVIIYNAGDGRRGIYIKMVQFRARGGGVPVPKAVGGLMLRSMLDGIRAVPAANTTFTEFTLMAAGGRNWGDIDDAGERWAGYAVWPKYGFDMKINNLTRALFPLFPWFPAGLADCVKVSEVLRLDGGQEFWAVVGDGWRMRFDALPYASEGKLNTYLEGVKL